MSGVAERWWAKEEEIDLTYRAWTVLLVAVVQVKVVGGEGLGTMFATAGGRVEETVEAEKGCNHVQARTKGGIGGWWQATRFRLLQWQDRRISVSWRNKQGALKRHKVVGC
jgi:hypothetical protein